jgi:hypothetical protein
MNALDRVPKKSAKFANHTNDSVWGNMAQRKKIALICDQFKTYTGERAWKFIGERLKGTYCPGADEHDRKN